MEDESNKPNSSISPLDRALIEGRQPLRCIVKLGGAAITRKNELESIDEESLRSACAQLREAMGSSGGNASPAKVLGMDWSRGTGELTVSSAIDELREHLGMDLGNNFIVVHGAGSFGHFQASRSGVHKGGLHLPLVKAGFVATRISVTSLNLEIVRALAREGIPSVGMSPFACGWSTQQRNIASADASQIIHSLHAGFVPTDVLGVYDRPPTDLNAVLIREIVVDEDGNWSIVRPALTHNSKKVAITVAAHDTTGGMETKISEAAMIAKLGIDVYIAKVGTEYSLRALKGQVRENPEDWLGTIIRSSK
ncbi:isopentenyl phosphate kinase isoform X3 [Typha latifolia]|uniref:isopentenyl phosphate kinase isoform X3 n=1 Tax=Typha latifolia TaxID=4733 RepID=UPI003C306DF5